MYGGLFGDLPPPKKAKTEQGENNEKGTSPGALSSDDSRKQIATSPLPTAPPTTKLNEKGFSSSVVGKLGATGTAFAFVPAAARRKKRPATSKDESQKSRVKPLTAPNTASDTGGMDSSLDLSQNKAPSEPSSEKDWTNVRVKQEDVSTPSSDHDEPSTNNKSRKDDEFPPKGASKIKQEELPETTTSTSNIPMEMPSTRVKVEEGPPNNVALWEGNNLWNATNAPHTTPKSSFQQDRYDPMIPNDLLEFWERKAAEKARQEQQAQRDELAKKLVMPVARGRGRGLSNLPAWMAEKQRNSLGTD